MDWYAWYWGKYESDALHLSLEQDAIYRRLIDWYMSRQCPVPDNDQAIASIVRISVEKWQENSAIIRPFFLARNGKLHLKRADEQLAEQKSRSAKRIEAAKKAADSRWDNKHENQQDKCDGHAEGMRDAIRQNATDRPTDLQTNIHTKPDKKSVEEVIHESLKNSRSVGFGDFIPSPETANQLRQIAYGWDQNLLVSKYNIWHDGKPRPQNQQAAFLGWARSFTKGKGPQ